MRYSIEEVRSSSTRACNAMVSECIQDFKMLRLQLRTRRATLSEGMKDSVSWTAIAVQCGSEGAQAGTTFERLVARAIKTSAPCDSCPGRDNGNSFCNTGQLMHV